MNPRWGLYILIASGVEHRTPGSFPSRASTRSRFSRSSRASRGGVPDYFPLWSTGSMFNDDDSNNTYCNNNNNSNNDDDDDNENKQADNDALPGVPVRLELLRRNSLVPVSRWEVTGLLFWKTAPSLEIPTIPPSDVCLPTRDEARAAA